MKKSAEFVHLHNHSEFSLLDGANRVEDMVKQAAYFGMPALALTDHGNMFGAVQFYQAAQKAGVKPIVGAEVYIAPGDRRERKIHAEIPEASFHLTLLCRNETGYRNLMRLVSQAYLDGFYYRPRIDHELLTQYASGLIAMSGCLKGEVNYFLRKGDAERAMQAAARYDEILGHGNFCLEVMRNGYAEQELIIPAVRELATTLDLPVVATNDCHYLRQDDARAHDALVCIQTGKRLADEKRLRMSSNQLYFRSPAEMARVFADMPDAVQRTRDVADRCNLELDFQRIRFQLPEFQPPSEFADAFGYLQHLAREGMQRRYQRVTPPLEERLNHELDVIRRMGFPGYFLVVKDIVDFARTRGIPVGPGRGSAAGSMVLYCLGITQIDPLRYSLLFERFLTTERVTLPDVDIDFLDTRRQEVVDYIRHRYGNDSVAQIITFGKMKSRAAVRDVGRVLDVPIAEVDQLAKLVPFGMELDQARKEVRELDKFVAAKPTYEELWTIARKLEGLNRHASVHASAVVIAPRPLVEFVPLYKPVDGEVCTQYDMHSLDAVGLLKMDVLGLRTLTVIEEAGRLVRAGGHEFDPDALPLDDRMTYEMLQRADTVGVFQLESAGMRDLCRRMQPDRIEHIIAIIALYRPGPMELISQYLARKAGTARIEYEHELLEPIARETYGVLIYQEQVMQAAQALAGYSLGEADLLRRAMGKKKPKEMAAQHDTFVVGCERHNRIPREKAERIFDVLARFAGYGFNKSHAAGYAYLSYITAFLKANYPVEFLAATLTSELGDSKKLAKFVNAARHGAVKVLGPDVNSSEARFTIEDGAVRFALAGVRGVGEGASEKIVAERRARGPYKSLLDFLTRNRGVVNRKAAESLIKAGAFDVFDPNRTALLESLEWEMNKAASERLQFRELQIDMFGTTVADKAQTAVKFDTHALLAYEKEAFGFYFSSHPLEPYRAEYEALGLKAIDELEGMKPDGAVALGGVITERRMRKDKRNREYAIVTVEDFDGAVEVMVFSDQLESCRPVLAPDNLIVVQGRVKVRVNEAEGQGAAGMPQVWAERVLALKDCGRYLKLMVLRLPDEAPDPMMMLKLKDLFASHPGECAVGVELFKDGAKARRVRLRETRVSVDNELLAAVREIVGPDRVRLVGELPCGEPDGRRFRKPRAG